MDTELKSTAKTFLQNFSLDSFTPNSAMSKAQEGMPGPVFVELPIDVLYPYSMTAEEIVGGNAGGKQTLQKRIVDCYMNCYLHNLFTKAFDDKDTNVSVTDLPINDADVTKVKSMLNEAERPVIVLQSQARLEFLKNLMYYM